MKNFFSNSKVVGIEDSREKKVGYSGEDGDVIGVKVDNRVICDDAGKLL